MSDQLAVTIRYRNHRGEVADRRIMPGRIWHGGTQWHPEPQWMLEAIDLEKRAVRDFAMRDILEWDPGPMPCPFCGAIPEVEGAPPDIYYRVICPTFLCPTRWPLLAGREAAVANWNRQAPAPIPDPGAAP